VAVPSSTMNKGENMTTVKDAYEANKGYAAVRDETGDVWVLKGSYITDSMSHDDFEKAIALFIKGELDAFENYNEKHHGLLHV
jgi:hypothetical protein